MGQKMSAGWHSVVFRTKPLFWPRPWARGVLCWADPGFPPLRPSRITPQPGFGASEPPRISAYHSWKGPTKSIYPKSSLHRWRSWGPERRWIFLGSHKYLMGFQSVWIQGQLISIILCCVPGQSVWWLFHQYVPHHKWFWKSLWWLTLSLFHILVLQPDLSFPFMGRLIYMPLEAVPPNGQSVDIRLG